MLIDDDIERLIVDAGLIENFSKENIRAASYTLRVGSIFRPGDGCEEERPDQSGGKKRVHWKIGPAECMIVKTREILSIPADVCAYYNPLNRLAQQGVMLLNASVIEPKYRGPLSCFLVNFSSRDVLISPDEGIAKITFHKLDGSPIFSRELTIPEAEYEKQLSASAMKFNESFLGIQAIEKRVLEASKHAASRSLYVGGGNYCDAADFFTA